MPSHCVCGVDFSVEHALSCSCGGLPSIRHNNIRDLTAKLLTEVCSHVSIEPSLQPLTGEILNHRSSNTEERDVYAEGFWGDRHQRAFFDVKVFNPLSPSNCRSSLASTYRQHESLKRRHYERVREIEHGSFTPQPQEAWHQQLQLPTKDLLLSWQTSANRTTVRQSAGSGTQSIYGTDLSFSQHSVLRFDHSVTAT